MTSEDAGGKSAPTKSGSVLSQEDSQEHQQERQPPQSGEGPKVLGQAAVRHDANSPAAGCGEAGDQTKRGEREQHVRPLRDWGGIVAIANVVLAFVGVGGLFFTAFQLGAMRDQLDQMRVANDQTKRQADAAENANKLAYRPWLTVSPLEKPALDNINAQKISLKIANTGKTPALQVRSKFRLVGTYKPQGPAPGPIEDALGELGVIFSDTHYTTSLDANFIGGRKPLSVNIEDALTYYIVGKVRYTDAFGDNHEIGYCSYIDNKVGNFTLCSESGRNYSD